MQSKPRKESTVYSPLYIEKRSITAVQVSGLSDRGVQRLQTMIDTGSGDIAVCLWVS